QEGPDDTSRGRGAEGTEQRRADGDDGGVAALVRLALAGRVVLQGDEEGLGHVPVQTGCVRAGGRLGELEPGGVLLPGVVSLSAAGSGQRAGPTVLAARPHRRAEGEGESTGAPGGPRRVAPPGRHRRRSAMPKKNARQDL